MSPEAQRIAIAEACGWRAIALVAGFGEPRKFPRGVPPGKDPRYWPSEQIPDYLNDLNAMHEAQLSLGGEFTIPPNGEWAIYFDNLTTIAARDDCLTCCLTAAQRAEAFLRTIGK